MVFTGMPEKLAPSLRLTAGAAELDRLVFLETALARSFTVRPRDCALLAAEPTDCASSIDP